VTKPALGHTDDVQTPDVTAQSRSTIGPLRSAVVVNPARVQQLAELRHVVDAAVATAGWPAPDWLETTPEDPGSGQARRAVEAGAEVVFVSGGDGTVRAALAGLAGTATPSSSATSSHGMPWLVSHVPNRPGVSVGEKRKMATGCMGHERKAAHLARMARF